MEVGVETLQAIGAVQIEATACQRRGHVEEHGQVGDDPAGRPQHQAAQLLEVEAASVSLVGEGRPREPFGDDPPTLVERGPHHLGHVLSPVGRHEQRLGSFRHSGEGGIEQERAQGRPSGVAPGSAVNTAPMAPASRTACVDFPQPSTPSRAISRPRPLTPSRASPSTPSSPSSAVAAFFARAFLAVVLFLALLADLAAFADFEALAARPARFTGGPAARRSASNSAARSMVIVSGSSPLRSDALVVPSVT